MEVRKGDHIKLASDSGVTIEELDHRFDYEPLMGSTQEGEWEPFVFMGREMKIPMWASSMTGGSSKAYTINANIAKACRTFGMGMGLGSCRILLDNNKHLPDFDVRDIIGNDLPLYANIGIAQLEKMMKNGSTGRLTELVCMLRADGLIIHVNPAQEYLQEEGDLISEKPVDTIVKFLSGTSMRIIVKEVGQGMGPSSLKHLLQMPLEAIETASFGGTNFAKLELTRRSETEGSILEPISRCGHGAEEMVNTINNLIDSGLEIKCKHLIISGGIKNFLDGYYLISKSKIPAIYGQASNLLRHAVESYSSLETFIDEQIKGLKFAKAWLKPRI